jgi:hypothetical protein
MCLERNLNDLNFPALFFSRNPILCLIALSVILLSKTWNSAHNADSWGSEETYSIHYGRQSNTVNGRMCLAVPIHLSCLASSLDLSPNHALRPFNFGQQQNTPPQFRT